MFFDDKIRRKAKLTLILAGVMAVLFIIWMLLDKYEVRMVYVEGNRHYTATQIRDMVERGPFGDNTIVLSWKYKNRSITDVPFVETMDVQIEDRNTIRIRVYEKTLAGYVRYLDRYMYFDKDGIVVESSPLPTEGIPEVTGLRFDHFEMYEPLEVGDPAVFQSILNVTQMLDKYEIRPDRIYFDGSGEMTLYFDTIRVKLGENRLLEEKIQQLSAILRTGELTGKSGVLDMGRYETGRESMTFTEE